MAWICFCGNLVSEKRFCPRCKRVRFTLDKPVFLDYSGPSLGTVAEGYPFNFPANYLDSHVLICGQTGTGKSRFAMNLAVKMENLRQPRRIKLVVIDVEGEWTGIIPFLKEAVEYYDVGSNLRINPFDLNDPALVRELLRETVFKGIEKEYVDLSAQMNFVLQEAIAESKNMPELIENIKSYNKHKLTSIDKTKTALLVRLDPFMRSPLKEIFLCNKSNPDFTKLVDRNIIIDLHVLDSLVAYASELRLIYNTISTYYLRSMLANDPQNRVSNLFIADEAQLLVPKILQKIIVTESWPATEFATRLRKRGCGLVLITQSPSNIEKDIFKNTATKFAFRLQSQEDIKLIADAAGFTDITEYEYLANYIVKLGRKQAIVCTDIRDPFMITADDFEPAKFAAMPLPAVTQLDSGLDFGKDEDLKKDEERFLVNIDREPFISVTERRNLLGWNDKKYSKIVDNLLERKVIEKCKVGIGRGNPRILYQKAGKIPSLKHEYYAHWLSEMLKEKGYTVIKNKVGPDLVVVEINTAIEVELGSSNMHGNISKGVQKFAKVIVCSDDEKVLAALSRRTRDSKILFLSIEHVPDAFEKKQEQKELKDT